MALSAARQAGEAPQRTASPMVGPVTSWLATSVALPAVWSESRKWCSRRPRERFIYWSKIPDDPANSDQNTWCQISMSLNGPILDLASRLHDGSGCHAVESSLQVCPGFRFNPDRRPWRYRRPEPGLRVLRQTRPRFVGELEDLFFRFLVMARAMGLLKPGTVNLDHTRFRPTAPCTRR